MKVSVLITTLNVADHLGRCLAALHRFDDVIVIDSHSADNTQDIARSAGVRVENFLWDGRYPKKRQWCLDNLDIKNDWVFFVDADEEVSPALVQEMETLDLNAAGYFVKGRYIWQNCVLRHGLCNNKLALFNRHKISFPAIDDLDLDGMGEIEGHYQPVLKSAYAGEAIGQVSTPLTHFAYEDTAQWQARHERYAKWEAQMIRRKAYPRDPSWAREAMKQIFRHIPWRGIVAFIHCYILKFGFLDGAAGYHFARSRFYYYQMVSDFLKTNKS